MQKISHLEIMGYCRNIWSTNWI